MPAERVYSTPTKSLQFTYAQLQKQPTLAEEWHKQKGLSEAASNTLSSQRLGEMLPLHHSRRINL